MLILLFDVSIELDKMPVCMECVEASHSHCENCDKLFPDIELPEVGDLSICPECIKNGILPFDDDVLDLLTIQ